MTASTAKSGSKTPPTGHSIPGFAQSLVKQLGYIPTTANVGVINEWLAQEGNNGPAGNNGVNNPLNIEANGKVANYASPQAGIQATAAFLQGSNYSGIRAVLSDPKATVQQIAGSIVSSKWAPGHYAGTNLAVIAGSQTSGSLGAFSSPGEFASSVANAPSEAASSVGTTAANALGVSGIGSDILYGMAIFGGALLVIVGIILIAADIGLGKALGNNPAVKVGKKATNYAGGRQERKTAKVHVAEKQYHVSTQARHRTEAASSRALSAHHAEHTARIRRTEAGAKQRQRRAAARKPSVQGRVHASTGDDIPF